jgi:hypothetical protein
MLRKILSKIGNSDTLFDNDCPKFLTLSWSFFFIESEFTDGSQAFSLAAPMQLFIDQSSDGKF